jgi:thiamine pyrophosphokinase
MKALIVGNGSIFKYDTLLEYAESSDYFICCDGGIKHFYECGIIPDIIIGDLDSAERRYIDYFKDKNVLFKIFQPEKDFTDMELSLLYALDLYSDFTFDEIFIFGGTGTRFDHSLTNAHILRKALDRGVLAWLIDENNKICLVDKHIKLSGNKNDLISLIPFTTEVFGVTTKGLYYGLSDAHMKIGASIGISNVMICDECEIFVQEGILFVILARD